MFETVPIPFNYQQTKNSSKYINVKGDLIMTTKTQVVIDAIAQELRLPREIVLAQGLKSLIEKNLREIKVEIFQITGKYGISSVREMEMRYRQRTLEEEDT